MMHLILAELQKIGRQRSLFAAGFFIVPLFALIAKMLMQAVVFRRMGSMNSAEGIDLLATAAKSLSISGNSLAHLFFALGVASIFVVDYRYATWRHLIPRRSRAQLWLAKFIAAFLCLFLSMALVLAGDVALTGVVAMAGDGGLSFTVAPSSLTQFLLSLLTACLELLVLAALTSLLTILFRSSMASVLIVFVLSLSTVMIGAYLGPSPELWWIPGEVAGRMRDAIQTAGGAGFIGGAVVLLVWSTVLIGLSDVLFSVQELRNE
ncbi:ABC transporter permease [Rhizobium helianthi]|uniref:ABC transporter permease n=1 Tax=Rhizobium helianthi TaxID=1132695 RepID=A0ABW4LYM5_9HYPH